MKDTDKRTEGCYTANGYYFLFRDQTGWELDDHTTNKNMAYGSKAIQNTAEAKEVYQKALAAYYDRAKDEPVKVNI